MSLHVAAHTAGQVAPSSAAIRPAARKCVDRRRTAAVVCCTSERVANDHVMAKNVAVAGMAALLITGHPQMAVAKDVPIQGQGDLLTELLEKNGGKGVKVLKAPKRDSAAPREAYKPAPKEAPKPAPVKAAAAAAKKIAPAPAKKASPVSAVSEKLKFSEPVKTGTTGILPKGFDESALPLPKALQKAGAAAADAAKSAASSVQSAASSVQSSVTPAPTPAPKEAVKKAFVNPLLQKRQSAPAAAPVEAVKNAFVNPLQQKKESAPAAKPVEAAKKAFVNPLLQKRQAAAPKKEEPKNVLAPAAAAAGAAAASAGAAIQKAVEPAVSSAPSLPAVPSPPSISVPSVSLPAFDGSTAQDTTEALGVLGAEVVGAAIASSIVGGITANVPSKKELKA